MGVFGKQFFERRPPVQDALLERRFQRFFEHGAVGRHAVRQRVDAGRLHDRAMNLVRRGGLFDAADTQLLDVAALAFGKGLEEGRPQFRPRFQHLVLHDDEVVDRVVAMRPQRIQARLRGDLANLYLNDPETAHDTIRAFVGLAVADTAQALPAGFRYRLVPAGQRVIAARLTGVSFLLSPNKLYPAALEAVKEQKLTQRGDFYLERFGANETSEVWVGVK